MISRTQARSEIARLSRKLGYPRNSHELSQLADALQLRAKGREHATLVINVALDASEHCPTVEDISRMCTELSSHADRYPPPCEKCAEYGGFWMKVSVYRKGVEVQALTRCDCPRGQLLEAREEAEKSAADHARM